jgi:tRNA/tmRNA/rRNA uracil-C5-methylase (TrmA/RlmC/RlmD family)
MTDIQRDQSCELEITDIAFGGEGVGRVDDCVVFVPFVLPGERVRARVRKRRKRYYFAELEEVLEPAPERVEPFCRFYGQCGGCQYQHMSYEFQLMAKHKQVCDIMRRIGAFEDDLPVAPVIPSPRTSRYRNRIDLHPHPDGYYGFCVRGRPREIFPLTDCPLFELERNLSGYPLRQADHLLVVRTHDDSPYCYFKDDHNNVRSAPFDLDTQTPMADETVRFTVGELSLSAHYGGFFQVNRWILPEFVATVRSTAAPRTDDALLDVYCGVGLFGLALAGDVAHVRGVEVQEGCIEFARRNARSLKIDSAEFAADTAEAYLRALVEAGTQASLCIVDPPRNGLTNKVVSALKRLRPQRLVYISCGPDTFARDARKLVDRGYALESIQPLDLFPNTKHIELVARFVDQGEPVAPETGERLETGTD